MALVSKRTGKPSDDMREELIDSADYGKPKVEADHELKEHNRKMQKSYEGLESAVDFVSGGMISARHKEHR